MVGTKRTRQFDLTTGRSSHLPCRRIFGIIL
jgi:hypothetical protein